MGSLFCCQYFYFYIYKFYILYRVEDSIARNGLVSGGLITCSNIYTSRVNKFTSRKKKMGFTSPENCSWFLIYFWKKKFGFFIYLISLHAQSFISGPLFTSFVCVCVCVCVCTHTYTHIYVCRKIVETLDSLSPSLSLSLSLYIYIYICNVHTYI